MKHGCLLYCLYSWKVWLGLLASTCCAWSPGLPALCRRCCLLCHLHAQLGVSTQLMCDAVQAWCHMVHHRMGMCSWSSMAGHGLPPWLQCQDGIVTCGDCHGLTFCLAPSRAVCVWSMAFTAKALALSVKLVFCPACIRATARLRALIFLRYVLDHFTHMPSPCLQVFSRPPQKQCCGDVMLISMYTSPPERACRTGKMYRLTWVGG